MVKYVIGQRKEAIERDKSLFQYPWDQSDVFYAIRTHLNKLGWDTSFYSDNVSGGYDRRKRLYAKIKPVCEEYYGVKRHEIGIYPEDRAVMAFSGEYYSVGFENLRDLMHNGTDVIVVEKAGTVAKMVPFTKNVGIAFIQSQGFVSEYGVALAALCNQQREIAQHYTKNGNGTYLVPKYIGHLGVLTDCDASGLVIGLAIKNAKRIGIGLDTIKELNNANPGLGLKIEDLQETTKPNTHWTGLNNILNGTGKVYEGLSQQEVLFYRGYLSEYHNVNDQYIRFIDYLKTNRIELNTILAAVNQLAGSPLPFWNWLKAKLSGLWPNRDYRRAIGIDDSMLTPTMIDLIDRFHNKTRRVTKDSVEKAEKGLENVQGFYDGECDSNGNRNLDVITKKEEIENDIRNNTLLTNEEIQKIDLGIKKFMEEHSLA